MGETLRPASVLELVQRPKPRTQPNTGAALAFLWNIRIQALGVEDGTTAVEPFAIEDASADDLEGLASELVGRPRPRIGNLQGDGDCKPPHVPQIDG